MAGEDPDHVWRNLRYRRGIEAGESRTIFLRYGTSCSAEGCHRCTDPDCTYADFIRKYWIHPRCD